MHILGLILIIIGVIWLIQGALLGGVLVIAVGFALGGTGYYRGRY